MHAEYSSGLSFEGDRTIGAWPIVMMIRLCCVKQRSRDGRPMLQALQGTSFDPAKAARLRRAYEIARKALDQNEPLDDAVSRKLVAALIRYARTDLDREPEEVARLAVMHVRLVSAPPAT